MDITNQPMTPSPAAADKAPVKLSVAEKAPVATELPKAKAVVTLTEASKDVLDQLILEVFGFDVLHQLKGNSWDERGQSVASVRARVLQGDFGVSDRDQFFKASCAVAVVALTDKVMPVFFDGLDLGKLLLGDFVQQQNLEGEILVTEIDRIIPIVVAKTSDRNARSMEAARKGVVFLAKQPHIGCQRVMSHILAPISNVKDISAIRGRLELIEHIMGEFGLSKNQGGLSLSGIMTFTRTHLEAADEKVRRAAVEVTVSCYKLKGDRTMKYCGNLKPALLKLLEQRFGEIDKKAGKQKSASGSAFPAVRGSKGRKPLARNNGFTGGKVPVLATKPPSLKAPQAPLAPLDLGNGDRGLVSDKRADSRQSDISLPSESKLASVDIFATDVLSDPMGDLEQITSPNHRAEPNPNFIPSPTMDENLMDGLMSEIEGF